MIFDCVFFQEKMHGFWIKWGIFEKKMRDFWDRSEILEEKMCDFQLNRGFSMRKCLMFALNV